MIFLTDDKCSKVAYDAKKKKIAIDMIMVNLSQNTHTHTTDPGK